MSIHNITRQKKSKT